MNNVQWIETLQLKYLIPKKNPQKQSYINIEQLLIKRKSGQIANHHDFWQILVNTCYRKLLSDSKYENDGFSCFVKWRRPILYTVQITNEDLWPCLWCLLTVIKAHDLN